MIASLGIGRDVDGSQATSAPKPIITGDSDGREAEDREGYYAIQQVTVHWVPGMAGRPGTAPSSPGQRKQSWEQPVSSKFQGDPEPQPSRSRLHCQGGFCPNTL